MGKALLNKKQRNEDMKRILMLYIEDENNLKDFNGKYKSYKQVVRDMKGLVSARIIKGLLEKINPELADAMGTRRKNHYSTKII